MTKNSDYYWNNLVRMNERKCIICGVLVPKDVEGGIYKFTKYCPDCRFSVSRYQHLQCSNEYNKKKSI